MGLVAGVVVVALVLGLAYVRRDAGTDRRLLRPSPPVRLGRRARAVVGRGLAAALACRTSSSWR